MTTTTTTKTTTATTTAAAATCLFNSNEHEICLLLLLPASLPSISQYMLLLFFSLVSCTSFANLSVLSTQFVLSSHLMPLVHFIMRKEEIERVCTIVRRDVWSTITTRNSSSSSSNENEISNVCVCSVVAYRSHFNWEKREFQYIYFFSSFPFFLLFLFCFARWQSFAFANRCCLGTQFMFVNISFTVTLYSQMVLHSHYHLCTFCFPCTVHVRFSYQ